MVPIIFWQLLFANFANVQPTSEPPQTAGDPRTSRKCYIYWHFAERRTFYDNDNFYWPSLSKFSNLRQFLILFSDFVHAGFPFRRGGGHLTFFKYISFMYFLVDSSFKLLTQCFRDHPFHPHTWYMELSRPYHAILHPPPPSGLIPPNIRGEDVPPLPKIWNGNPGMWA